MGIVNQAVGHFCLFVEMVLGGVGHQSWKYRCRCTKVTESEWWPGLNTDFELSAMGAWGQGFDIAYGLHGKS